MCDNNINFFYPNHNCHCHPQLGPLTCHDLSKLTLSEYIHAVRLYGRDTTVNPQILQLSLQVYRSSDSDSHNDGEEENEDTEGVNK